LTVSDSLLFAYIFSNSTSSYSRDIYVTSNLGETWKKVNDSVSASGNINAITANKKYLFAGTQMGEWRLPISSIVTSVKEDKMQTPSGYYLSQNYPNPFNPNTVINYQLSAYSHVTLKVYDVLGRLVKTLIDGYKSQGNYSVNFNAADLASGIYFYQLKAGNFTETKKLSLLK
ncbi:MAG: T9SS type A sorting domain-containing protein, partial [Ignavibacteriaceae bacterium]|nr:T9SS type A sorting domain-containing protein [Ignavibacteriaceae bacterium]